MKVQRVRVPDDSDRITWLVLGDDYLPIHPIQCFLAYLDNLERSPYTIQSYAHSLKLYWEYLHDFQLDWKTVSYGAMAEFIAWLRNPPSNVMSIEGQVAARTESTINTITAAVASFYDYQQREGEVKAIPLYRDQAPVNRRYKGFLHHVYRNKPIRRRLIKLKEPRLFPKTLATEQVEQLIAGCRLIRDKFLVLLLYETGIRIGQALGLRHEDIKSWDNKITIIPRNDNANGARAKTKTSYTIDTTKELMALYTDYILNEFGDIDSDYVFVSLKDGFIGHPMKYATVIRLFHRLGKKFGFSAHPHMLRHTHATELIRSGWDAAYVQKRLGHAHIQTTMNTYTHLNDDDMKEKFQDYQERRKH